MKIRYYGSAGYMSGYAHAANELCMSLLCAGADLELRPYGGAEHEKPVFEGDFAELAACVRDDDALSKDPDVIIVHAPPLDAANIARRLRGVPGLRVAYTTWEALSVPSKEFMDELRLFDRIWVPCEHNRKLLALDGRFSAARFATIPHAFAEDSLPDRRRPRRDDIGARPYRFYYIGHWNGRKNPAGVIRAWARAFTKADPVELVMQVPRASDLAVMTAIHGVGAELRDRMAPIRISATPITEIEIRDLHRTADCFVSTSRAEAWNLPAFHAMLAGRAIIATRGLGSDDFLEETSAHRVRGIYAPCHDDVDVIPDGEGSAKLVFSGSQGASCKTDWMEPDLCTVADRMRHVFECRERDLRIQYNPLERYGRKAVGALAMKALEGK